MKAPKIEKMRENNDFQLNVVERVQVIDKNRFLAKLGSKYAK